MENNNEIGLSAGVIWQLLKENGAMGIVELRTSAEIKAATVMLALGWLAREDKIHFFEQSGDWFVELTY